MSAQPGLAAAPPDASLPRGVLAAAALGAAVLYQLMLLGPIALVLAMGALWYGHPVLMGLAVLAFFFLAWLVQPSWRLDAQVLPREQAPQLYARIDAIADALQAPRVHQIALSDELNAGALELNRGLSLRPTRRVLVLGLPLLRLLDTAAAEAVVAHELGHFSRQHGRLGHWLYRTRHAWAQWGAHAADAEDDEDSTAWDRAASWFAASFLPWFQRATDAHARRCEHEADALAARLGQPSDLARALLLLDLAALREPDVMALLDQRLQQSATPPADWAELPALAVAQREATAEERLQALPDHPPRGTHPSNRLRLQALGCAPDGLSLRAADWADSAAAHWLGSAWTGCCQQQSPWASTERQLSWQMGHAVAATGLPAPAMAPVARLAPAAARQRLRRLEQATEALEQGEVQPGALTEAQLLALDRGLAVHPAAAQAWALSVAVAAQEGEPAGVPVLMVRLDPQALERLDLHEGQVREQLQDLLDRVHPPVQDWLIRLSYTTEGLPPSLQAQADRLPRLPSLHGR